MHQERRQGKTPDERTCPPCGERPAPADCVRAGAGRRARPIPDGTIRLACPAPLGAYDPSLARLFRAAVEAQPARIFLQERAADGWRKLDL